MTEEGVRHEGSEEGYLSVGLSHFHFPQLHLDGLGTQIRSLKGEKLVNSYQSSFLAR